MSISVLQFVGSVPPPLTRGELRGNGRFATTVGFATFVDHFVFRFQCAARLHVDASTEWRHQRVSFPDGIDSRFDLDRRDVRFNGKFGFVAKVINAPIGLTVEVLFLNVGSGDRRIDQVSHLRVHRSDFRNSVIILREILTERGAGQVAFVDCDPLSLIADTLVRRN